MEDELMKIIQCIVCTYDGMIYCKNCESLGGGYYDCKLNLERCRTCKQCILDLERIKLDYDMPF